MEVIFYIVEEKDLEFKVDTQGKNIELFLICMSKVYKYKFII